jgi:hypothetical protein
MTDKQIDRVRAFATLAGATVLCVCILAGALTGQW